MEVFVLASGSSGNAVLVRSGETLLLLDAGVSALQIRRRMEAFGQRVERLNGILLTHEHSDHVRGLEVLLKRRPTPVWATHGTWAGITVRTAGGGELTSGVTRTIGGIRVTPVATSHDAREPVALILDDGDHSAALCTDTGVFTTLLEQRIVGCELLLMETNHDLDLLRHGPYPWPLKQRISSRVGHLSNDQSQEAVERVASKRLRAVVGMHLSAENNTIGLVRETLSACVGDGVAVEAVPRGHMLRICLNDGDLDLEPREVPPTRR